MAKNRLTKVIHPGAFSFVSLFLLSAMLFCSYFFSERIEVNTSSDVFLFGRWIEMMSPYPMILFVINFVLTILIAFLLFLCNEKFSFIRIRTMLPSFFFIFSMLMSNLTIEHSEGLIGTLFLLIFIWIFLSTYNTKEPVESIFNAFLYLSVGSFLSFELLLIVPFLVFFLFIFRTLSLRTILAAIVGLITPYILYISVLFLTGDLAEFLLSQQNNFNSIISFSFVSSRLIARCIFLALLFLIAFASFMTDMNSDKIKTRRMMDVLFLTTFCMIIILALNLASFANVFPMFAMLLSILLGYYFSLKTSIFSFVLFILVIMSSICFYFW